MLCLMYLMYKLICQKPANFLYAQMAGLSSFRQMFIALGIYNSGVTKNNGK